ncbi:hypothetical protein Tco_0351298 [Tanacetum coccineum]
MEDLVVASGSSGTPSTVERSPLDFDNENPAPMVTEGTRAEDQAQDVLATGALPKEAAATTEVIQEAVQEEEVVALESPINKRRKQMRRKRVNEEVEVNASPKVLRKDHVSNPAHSIHGGKSLPVMGLDAGSTFSTPDAQDDSTTANSVSDPDPLSYSKSSSKGTAIEIPPQHVAVTKVNVLLSVGSPDSGKLTYVPSVEGSPSGIYQPAWGVTNSCRLDTPKACQELVDHTVPPGYFSELRHLPNAEFLGQYNMNLARQNLETLLEAEVDMKKVAEAKNVELTKELESLRVTSEERIKAAFEEFKKYEDNNVEQRCAEMDARLDKLNVDFDEELYPHMLTAIAGLAKGMSEGLKYGIEHGKAGRDLANVKAYDPEANNKLVKALQDLKDLKYPMLDQLEKLKDAPMELIMASLHLENPWFVKEEVPLEDAIAANISRAEKKKKCRVVCRTHGIESAHHARFDGILVSVPTVVPQGLAILLTDAGTQT